MSGRLAGKAAIVTGAAHGIGRAIADAMAQEGARVLVADREAEAGARAAEEINAAGGQAAFHPTDVADTEQVRQMVAAAVARWGGLDILVNNAGLGIPGTAADISEEDWARVININLTGVWRGMKFAIPEMLKRGGGAIVSISSVQAQQGLHNWAGYAASKGGIDALTRQAAVEYAPRGIRVNAIAPGTIITPNNSAAINALPDRDKIMAELDAAHPMGRCGRPEEIAWLAVFLASDEASFITGQVYVADGGRLVRGD